MTSYQGESSSPLLWGRQTRDIQQAEKARRQCYLAKRKYTLGERAGGPKGQDQLCLSEFLVLQENVRGGLAGSDLVTAEALCRL